MSDEQESKLGLICAYLVIVLVGGSFLGAGIYEAYQSAERYQKGLRAIGKVQKVEDKSNTDADWTTYEVVFVAANHQSYTIQNHYSTNDDVKLYRVGQVVPVVYLPTAPEDGRIDSRREQSGVYGGCFVGALIALVLGSSLYYFLHRPLLRRPHVPGSSFGSASAAQPTSKSTA